MRPFSFIHAADLHIDSPFRGVSAEAPEIATALHASTFRAYQALVETCIERGVDFLLIAGDVYDGQDRSLRAQLRFRDGLARLAEAGIRSYVVHGNHDPLDGRVGAIDWPEQVHVFGKQIDTVEFVADGEPVAAISGVSFPKREVRQNLARKFKRRKSTLFQIGLLHCNVGSDTGHEPYAPCDLEDLRSAGMDYWALGHVHTRQVLAQDPWVVYPGNTQARHSREQDARGCYLVQVDAEGQAELEFVPLDVIRWVDGRISITEVESLDALEGAIVAKIEALARAADGRGIVCRIAVDGRGPLYGDLRAEDAADHLLERIRERFDGEAPFIWVQRVDIDARPEIDLADRAKRGDLLGEVLTAAREYREEDGLSGLYEQALAECWGNTRVKKALDPPSAERLAALLTEAELLCLDLLEDDR